MTCDALGHKAQGSEETVNEGEGGEGDRESKGDEPDLLK